VYSEGAFAVVDPAGLDWLRWYANANHSRRKIACDDSSCSNDCAATDRDVTDHNCSNADQVVSFENNRGRRIAALPVYR
jgi:hypothetical protein